MPHTYLRLSKPKLIFMAAGVAILLNIHTARSQSLNLPLEQGAAAPEISTDPALMPNDCGPAPLSGNALMSALSKIIEHHDLTDVPFVEKSLDTKFPYVGSTMRMTVGDHVLGSALSVRLGVFDFGQEMAALNIPSLFGDHNYLQDCVLISKQEFMGYFGRSFTVAYGEAYAWRSSPGKNNSKILLVFGWDSSNEIVTSIILRQWRQ